MSQINETTVDGIFFENVTCHIEGRDPVLERVDFEFPLDQTIVIKSSLPDQAVILLEILAGRREASAGRVLINQEDQFQMTHGFDQIVGASFEKDRPALSMTMVEYWKIKNILNDEIIQIVDFFDLKQFMDLPIRLLPFSLQKLVQMIHCTLKKPQILILEDPATGLTEDQFLNFLDWINYGQRHGYHRHVFLTNNHPTAMRHLTASFLYIEDGLLYLDELEPTKKVAHF